MPSVDDISAVIVTRGDHDLSPILNGLPFNDIVVWDNSKEREDMSVYGRYEAIERAKNEFIYVQDDDCLVPAWHLVHQWDGDPKKILLNMPADHGNYSDSGLVGWGSIFHRDLPGYAFFRYIEFFQADEMFRRTCDVVFTTLVPFTRVALGHESLPYAYGEDRMYHRPDHEEEREKALEQSRYVRDFPHPYWSGRHS